METLIPLIEGLYTEIDPTKHAQIEATLELAGINTWSNHILAQEPAKFLPLLLQVIASPLGPDAISTHTFVHTLAREQSNKIDRSYPLSENDRKSDNGKFSYSGANCSVYSDYTGCDFWNQIGHCRIWTPIHRFIAPQLPFFGHQRSLSQYFK